LNSNIRSQLQLAFTVSNYSSKMNLCGGIAGVTDHELVFRFPDEEFSVSSRKKKSSSSSTSSRRDKSTSGRSSLRGQSSSTSRHPTRSSRGSGITPSNQLSTSTSPASALNPISRHDYEKQRIKNQSRPSRGMKSASILTRKLESGFNLAWINGGRTTQPVNLSTNSDKSYLRIRMRSKDEEESENDGSKVNQRDVKIKVRHISRIGSDIDLTSERRDNHNSSIRPQNKCFVIKIKYNDGEFNQFKFLAQSLAERDSVLLAIRSLIGQGRHVQGNLPSKSQSLGYKSRSNEFNVKCLKAQKIHDHRNEIVGEEIDSFNIPVPNRLVNPIDNEKFPTDSRDDNGFGNTEDSERNTRDSFKNSINRENGRGKVYDSCGSTHKLTTPQSIFSTTKLNRNKNSAWMEKKIIDSNVRAAKKNVATSGRNRQHQSVLRTNHNKARSRSPRMIEHQRNHTVIDRAKPVLNKLIDPKLYEESITCNPIGRPLQALSALEDGYIANLAATSTNPVTGPWCTDDVCTASLKDFADSMTGIFDLKDHRNMKGVCATDRNQRAIAEEYISGFLSNNANMSELLSVKDLWNVAATKHATGNEIKRKQFHNRSRNSNGKATRIMNLRKQMTFEGADTENTTFLQTISSFDDVSRKANGDTDDCELLYYDSDPEDVRECTLKRGPRVAISRRKQALNESNTKRREALNILDTSRFGLGRKWKRLGQDVLSDIIEATKNEKLTLLWHRTQNNENSNMPPVCVKVWVESGVYLTDGSFLLPKLTWLPAHEKNLDSRLLNVSYTSPGSIDLLDVCRVRECQSIDRRLYPFAHVERSFIIQTQNVKYMFEAQSKQERGRVVNGLKLVIARLASLLMLRDLRAVDEFFGGNAVPGEAPFWARNHEKNESTADFPPA